MKRKVYKQGLLCIGMVLISGFLILGGKAEAAKKFDPSGKYHASLGVATDYTESVHRDAYYEKKYTKDPNRERLVIGQNGQSGYQIMEGTFKNTTLKGNGTYSVSLTNADFNYNRSFRKLYVATDIPNTGAVTFKNVSVSINGTKYYTYEKAVLDSSREHRKYCVLLVLDKDNPAASNVFSRSSVPGTRENQIVVTFQVKGFSYKKGGVPPTPTPIPTVTPEVEESVEPVSAVPADSGVVQTEEQSEEDILTRELPVANKAGIAVTVVVAIGGIVLCVFAVHRRQH